MAYKLSPSSLALLEECPRCFWLKLVRKLKRPEGVFPTLPSGIDRVLKQHFDSFTRAGRLPPVLERACPDCKLFADEALLREWRNPLKGIKWLDEESGVLLRGAVDALLELEGKLIVLDFKTRGFDLREDTPHHYRDQLNVYNFLLRKSGFPTHDYSLLLFYIPERVSDEGDFVFKTELVRMPVNVEHAEALFRKAVRVLQSPMPACSPSCEFCGWANVLQQKTL